jgi:hypothetical protein
LSAQTSLNPTPLWMQTMALLPPSLKVDRSHFGVGWKRRRVVKSVTVLCNLLLWMDFWWFGKVSFRFK